MIWIDQAFRSLRRSPAFSVPAIVMLSGGIAASLCCYAVMDAAVFRAIPYQSPQLLYQLVIRGRSMARSNLSGADFELVSNRSHCFESLAYEENFRAALTEKGGQTNTVLAARVSRDYFKALGLRAQLGRLPADADFRSAGTAGVVFSHALWASKFFSNKNIPGSRVTIDGEDMVVLGVLEEKVRHPVVAADVWITDIRSHVVAGDGRNKYVIGRLRHFVPAERATQELLGLHPTDEAEFPKDVTEEEQFELVSVVDLLVGSSSRILRALLLACLILQLLACMSVGQLLVARRVSRLREAGIRLALGSSQARLWVEALGETAALMSFACLGAVAVAYVLLPAASAAASSSLGSPVDAEFTLGVFRFLALLALGSSILCSAFPLFLLRQLDSSSLIRARWESAVGSFGATHLQDLLMMGQLAGTVVLAVSFGLLLKSMYQLNDVSLGFVHDRLSCFVLGPSKLRFPASVSCLRSALAELSRSQDVQSTAVGSVPFLSGADMKLRGAGVRKTNGAWTPLPAVLLNAVSPEYFGTLGIEVVRGRSFNEGDREAAPCVVILNRSLAQSAWPDEKGVGERLALDWSARPQRTCEVIGVVDDVRDVALARPPEPEIFTSLLQREGSLNAVIFLRAKPGRSISPQGVLKAIAGADPSREVEFASDVDELVSRAKAPGAARVKLFGAMALTALLLAAGGAYSAARFGLSLRVRELSVRLALGARPHQIVGLICRHYLRLSVSGVLLGLGISGPVLHSFAHSVAVLDGRTLDATVLLTASITCLVAIVASVIVPAITALRAATESRLLSADSN